MATCKTLLVQQIASLNANRGGGNLDNLHLDQGRPSLRWMAFEAMDCGLLLEPYRHPLDRRRISFSSIESLTGGWWPLELLPVSRLRYGDQERTSRSRPLSVLSER